MRVTLRHSLSGADAEDYDRFAAEARGAHYSQARTWSDVATAGRPLRASYFLARDGHRVIGCGLLLRPSAGPLGAPVAHMERGPVCDDPERVADVARALCHAARLRGVTRVRIMPYWAGDDAEAVERALPGVRFSSIQAPDGAHVYTLRLSIGSRTDAEILAGGERRSLRSELKQAERHGARVRLGGPDDLATFARLHADLMQRQGKGTKPAIYYERLARHVGEGGEVDLSICEHEGDAVAAVIVVRHGRLATFVMGASDASRRPFTKMAPALMCAIRRARERGCETFDLGGVPMPGDTDEKRTNIARFKLDFSTTPVKLVGEHARWL